ncbi:MAG: hypothetical protein WCJ40_03270 [Planctomycetota bacterium]|nr:hypothetical protein [Planctomycetota bacterium]
MHTDHSHDKEVDILISVTDKNSAHHDPALDGSLIGRLLSMANRYRLEGNLRQATEIYWSLLENHNGTKHADAAKAALMDVAMGYEQDESRHMARSIYEDLLKYEG